MTTHKPISATFIVIVLVGAVVLYLTTTSGLPDIITHTSNGKLTQQQTFQHDGNNNNYPNHQDLNPKPILLRGATSIIQGKTVHGQIDPTTQLHVAEDSLQRFQTYHFQEDEQDQQSMAPPSQQRFDPKRHDLYLVQFNAPITQNKKNRVFATLRTTERLGQYIPHDTFLVYTTHQDALAAATTLDSDDIKHVLHYLPAWRVSPAARVGAGGAIGAGVQATITIRALLARQANGLDDRQAIDANQVQQDLATRARVEAHHVRTHDMGSEQVLTVTVLKQDAKAAITLLSQYPAVVWVEVKHPVGVKPHLISGSHGIKPDSIGV